MKSLLRAIRCEQSGQTLLEFGLVALMTVMTALGVVDICRMVLVYTTIADAARIGARYAAVHGSDSTISPQVSTFVTGYLRAGTLNPANATVTPTYPSSGSCTSPGCFVRVTVSYPYNPLLGYFHLPHVNLASTSQAVITY